MRKSKDFGVFASWESRCDFLSSIKTAIPVAVGRQGLGLFVESRKILDSIDYDESY